MNDIELMNQSSYSDKDIHALEDREAVRLRPGMYIGATTSKGLHHLVWEIIDNSIDEAIAGYCTEINLIVSKDNEITIKDNGRGIPTGINNETNISTIETVFTVLHAGGKFDSKVYNTSGGLHGVGATVVNYLSSYLEVNVFREGNRHYIRFEDGGKTTHPLSIIDSGYDFTGTEVKFKPDKEIFIDTTEFDYDILKRRIRQMAFLTRGLKLTIKDERTDTYEEFKYDGGIKEYVTFIDDTNKRSPLFENVIYCEGSELISIPNPDGSLREASVEVEIAFHYNKSYESTIFSYCNNISTTEHGTHVDGFRMALARVINNYAKKNNLLKNKDESIGQADTLEGLTAIISIRHPNPIYEGQTKAKLGNSDARQIISKIFGHSLHEFMLENPNVSKMIVEKSISAQLARKAAESARNATRRKSALESSSLPGKLADCSSKVAEECELYIVEGNSAGGSAKQGRDSNTQAILPLRGKILNVEKAKSRIDRIYGNEEIRSMITALGTGVEDEFDIKKARYHKIVIMTDADVDGSHIKTLMLTFFYRFMPELILNGYLYIAQPPLFKVEQGKKLEYVYDEKKLEEIKQVFNENQKINIQRYKGLGEMNPEQLWETTMNPEHRILLKVDIDDAEEASEVFSMLMGEEVAPRKEFIQNNAQYVTNLDI
ncbi:MAG: DNA topoisomerase (ATP-hydrolyzing) subunit B [Bacilli bacterium]|jgi:DNA gyrase subunit B|nr:DNA topoisomerase (ATP-hydrolyzing) subunit B [Bacilli bacterium]